MAKRMRPKIEAPLEQVNFRIDPQLMGQIRQIATENGDSIGLTLNKIIKKGLAVKI